MHRFAPELQHTFISRGSKISIALHLENLKFISFWLLSPNHCYHGNTTHFMAIKTFYSCSCIFMKFSKSVFAMTTSYYFIVFLWCLQAIGLWHLWCYFSLIQLYTHICYLADIILFFWDSLFSPCKNNCFVLQAIF